METVYCFLIYHHFPTLVDEPKFHSFGRCTIALTTMHSDGMSIASSSLAFFHVFVCLLRSSLFPLFILHLGV